MVGQTVKKFNVPSADDRNRICQFSKTKLCRFELLGMCAKGPQCPFAHGDQELRDQPDLRCTKMCVTLLQTGSCSNKDCTFAHTKSELRSKWGSSNRKAKARNLAQSMPAAGNHVSATPVEKKLSVPVKVPMKSAVTPAPVPYLVDALPLVPPPPGLHCPQAEFGFDYHSFNDFGSLSDTSSDSYTSSPIAKGRTNPTGNCFVDAAKHEPAYVQVTMPEFAFLSQRSGASDDSSEERAGFDFGVGLNFLRAGKFAEGWPAEQPSSLRSISGSFDSIENDTWRVQMTSLPSTETSQMKYVSTSQSTLCSLSDGEATQQASNAEGSLL